MNPRDYCRDHESPVRKDRDSVQRNRPGRDRDSRWSDLNRTHVDPADAANLRAARHTERKRPLRREQDGQSH